MIKKYFIKRVSPYTATSKWWGIAWYDVNHNEVVLMPLGINYIVNWVNEILYYLGRPTIAETKYELQEENINLKRKIKRLEDIEEWRKSTYD